MRFAANRIAGEPGNRIGGDDDAFEFSRFSNFRNFERDVDRITGNRETGYEWDFRDRGIAVSRHPGGVSCQLLWRQNGLDVG